MLYCFYLACTKVQEELLQTPRVGVGVSVSVGVAQMLKFLVKVFMVFMSLYLLKLLMDQVDTLLVGRCWSAVLYCTITTHLGDLEVKVTDFEILL